MASERSSHRSRIKSAFFGVVAIGLVLGALVIAELVAGQVGNVGFVRTETKRFVSESAPLITTTRWLQPNLADEFINEQPEAGSMRLVRTDTFGLVLGPSDVKYEESAQKILFLGGSTTENNEVDEHYRFPFLAPFLVSKSSGQAFEGLNAGVRGHTSHDSLNLFLNHLSPRIQEARVVVVMHNINDRLRLTLHESYRSTFTHSSEATAGGLRNAAEGLARSFWDWARLNSNFLFLADTVATKFRSSGAARGIPVTERALDEHSGVAVRRLPLFEQSLRNLIAVVRSSGKLPILMTQPLGRHSVDQDAFNDRIRGVAMSEAVGLIDLARSMETVPDRQVFFYDDHIHFNNAGSKWASEEIARVLQGLLGAPKVTPVPQARACPDLQIGGLSLLAAPLNEKVLMGRYPSFDRTERRILFQRNHSTGSAIVVFDVTKGQTEELVRSEDPLGLEHPTWVDDQTILYTQRSRDDRRLMIFALNDRSARPLLADKSLQGAIANVAPGGVVYFSGYRHSDQKPPALYTLSAGGATRALTLPISESWRPFASSSGEIYFINNESGRYQIYVKKPDEATSIKRRVIPSQYEQWDPAVSPDGTTLAFSQREGGNFDLYVLRLGTRVGHPVRIVGTSEDEWDPRFSPSGRYLLYAATSPHGDQIRTVCVN